MDEPIFIIGSDGKLASVQKNTYDREAELQQLINDHPELIPGMGDIGESKSIRWLLVQREAGIPREDGGSDWWSIDHILVDQFATPTFVEVKRASDTRVRREVVAQMLDYVANATLYWQPGTLEGWFSSQDEEPDQRLLEFLDDAELSPENFWSRVDENLRSGRVRCVFVADSIPDSLIRLVEFLNEHLRLTEVYAVELPQYVSADQLPGVRVIVPKLIGNTTRAIANKSEVPSAPKRQWDEESFFADLGERSDPACVALCREILEWTRVQGVRVVYGNGKIYGSMILVAGPPPNGYVFASIWSYGKIEIDLQYVRRSPAFQEDETRREVIRKFNRIPGVSIDEASHSLRPNLPLTLFVDDPARHELFAILSWMTERLRSDLTA
ncbi:MAG: hypothetical protein ACYCU8_15740 [Ferrimicrobium acidiphilum]